MVFAIVLIALILAGMVLGFLRFYPSVGKLPDKAERAALEGKSKQFSDGQFHNESEISVMTGKAYPSSERKIPKTILRAQTPEFLSKTESDDLGFTWFGHSSFLLQMGSVNVLVDPVFSDRSSPVSFAGPKRFSELPLLPEELPDIDVLFISHDHYDHLDYQTILKIRDRVGAFIVPLGMDAILRGWGVDADRIHALDWWEEAEIGSITYTLTPAQHFSGRNPLKGNGTLWGGLYLRNNQYRVYYTGDGGYCGVFGDVRSRLGAPDLMIAECGQYDQAWSKIHMFPEETVRAGLDTGTKWLIPVHWGSFCICNHAWDDSIKRVTAAAETNSLAIATPEIGQSVRYTEISSYTAHWWEAYE